MNSTLTNAQFSVLFVKPGRTYATLSHLKWLASDAQLQTIVDGDLNGYGYFARMILDERGVERVSLVKNPYLIAYAAEDKRIRDLIGTLSNPGAPIHVDLRRDASIGMRNATALVIALTGFYA